MLEELYHCFPLGTLVVLLFLAHKSGSSIPNNKSLSSPLSFFECSLSDLEFSALLLLISLLIVLL